MSDKNGKHIHTGKISFSFGRQLTKPDSEKRYHAPVLGGEKEAHMYSMGQAFSDEGSTSKKAKK